MTFRALALSSSLVIGTAAATTFMVGPCTKPS
jgi:hypothetical protein